MIKNNLSKIYNKKYLIIGLFILLNFDSKCQLDTIKKESSQVSLEEIITTLNECNCFVAGFNSELNEKEVKLVSRVQALMSISYNQLDSLFNNSNNLIKLYSFGGICYSYPDRIKDSHLIILENTEPIKIYTQNSNDFPSVPTNELARSFYEMAADIKLSQSIQKKVEQIISDFILEYSKFPNSYETISFQNFHAFTRHDGETLKQIGEPESFSIKHNFKLKNRNSTFSEFSCYFKLDSEFKINIIEKEYSDILTCFPPKLDWWLTEFGRNLTKKDKKELNLE